jgi:catechol 2,3-dioxygenase-like lactoylglutathione lyase family enzyme
MRFICPLLAVHDVGRSVRFYRDLLGQQVQDDFGANVTFAGGFAVHLETHFGELLGPAAAPVAAGRGGFELYFEDDAVADVERRLVDAGVRFVHPLREQPWRQRVIRFHDPDGHLIEVGESMTTVVRRLAASGLTAEQIGQETSLAAGFVSQALAGFGG